MFHPASLPLLHLAVELIKSHPGYQAKSLDDVVQELLTAGEGIAIWFTDEPEADVEGTVH